MIINIITISFELTITVAYQSTVIVIKSVLTIFWVIKSCDNHGIDNNIIHYVFDITIFKGFLQYDYHKI